MNLTLPTVTCRRCGYRWVPRRTPVVLCASPACRSARFNEPRATVKEPRKKEPSTKS